MHPDLIFSDSQARMQLDIYIPSLKIAFEFHGHQHYEQRIVYAGVSEVKKRDIGFLCLAKVVSSFSRES